MDNYDVILDDDEVLSLESQYNTMYTGLQNYISHNEGVFGAIKSVANGVSAVVKFVATIIKKISRMLDFIFSIFYSKINKLKLRNKYLFETLRSHRGEFIKHREKYDTRVVFDHYGDTASVMNAVASFLTAEHALVDIFVKLAANVSVSDEGIKAGLDKFKEELKKLQDFADHPSANHDSINIYLFGSKLNKQNDIIVRNGNDNEKVIKATKKKIDDIKKYINNKAESEKDESYVSEGGAATMHQKGVDLMKKYLVLLPKFKVSMTKVADTHLETTKLVTDKIEYLSD